MNSIQSFNQCAGNSSDPHKGKNFNEIEKQPTKYFKNPNGKSIPVIVQSSNKDPQTSPNPNDDPKYREILASVAKMFAFTKNTNSNHPGQRPTVKSPIIDLTVDNKKPTSCIEKHPDKGQKAMSDPNSLKIENTESKEIKEKIQLIINSIESNKSGSEGLNTALDSAIAKYQELLDGYPKHRIYLLNKRADVYRLLKNYDLALKDLNEVLDQNPTHTDALSIRASVYCLQENYTEAQTDIDQVLKQKSTHKIALSIKKIVDKKIKEDSVVVTNCHVIQFATQTRRGGE